MVLLGDVLLGDVLRVCFNAYDILVLYGNPLIRHQNHTILHNQDHADWKREINYI